jgi:hypothetical protein
MERPANEEMVAGFRDGYDLSLPEPGPNRSHSYRHGFMCARIDKRKIDWTGTADDLRVRAANAMAADEAQH